jgi:HK97 family phage major capsid protein
MSSTRTREILTEKLADYSKFIHSGAFTEARNIQFRKEIDALQVQLKAQQDFDANFRGITVARIDRNALNISKRDKRAADKAEAQAFELTMRGKKLPIQLRDYAPLSTQSESGGLYLVPQITADEIDHLVKSPGQLLSAVRTVPTSIGGAIRFPTSDGTLQAGEWVGESSSIGQANATYGHTEIDSFQWSSKEVLAPRSLVQDVQYPLLQNLTEEFAQRAARGWSTRIVADATDGLLSISGTGSLSAASATALDYFEALNLQSKVDPGYAQVGSYVMSYSTMLGYAALKTTNGASVWPERERSAGLMHSRPFVIANDIPIAAHATKYLAFGDLSKILFRKVGQMTVHVLNEQFQNNLQVGYIAEQRVASKVIQPSALAFLVGA